MKKISFAALALAVSTGSALAADLPSRKAPVLLPPPPPTWTRFYVGLNAGGTWANNNATRLGSGAFYLNPINPPANRASPADFSLAAALGATANLPGGSAGGFIGGGQIGYNRQVSLGTFDALIGLEADIQGIAGGSGNSGGVFSEILVPRSNPTRNVATVASARRSVEYIGTVRGRIGFLPTPTLLVYGAGGLAYGGVNASVTGAQVYDPPALDRVVAGFNGGSFSNTRAGWIAGGGLEWMFATNWSAKAEYLYYDLGSARFNAGVSTATDTSVGGAGVLWANAVQAQARFNGNIVRAGLNYHFNWAAAPVVAKY